MNNLPRDHAWRSALLDELAGIAAREHGETASG